MTPRRAALRLVGARRTTDRPDRATIATPFGPRGGIEHDPCFQGTRIDPCHARGAAVDDEDLAIVGDDATRLGKARNVAMWRPADSLDAVTAGLSDAARLRLDGPAKARWLR